MPDPAPARPSGFWVFSPDSLTYVLNIDGVPEFYEILPIDLPTAAFKAFRCHPHENGGVPQHVGTAPLLQDAFGLAQRSWTHRALVDYDNAMMTLGRSRQVVSTLTPALDTALSDR